MTPLGVICMLVTALSIGYHFGRRHAGSTTPTWKDRTRRTALGRRAITLIALMVASHLQRSVQRKLPSSRGWRRQVVPGRCWRPIGVLLSRIAR